MNQLIIAGLKLAGKLLSDQIHKSKLETRSNNVGKTFGTFSGSLTKSDIYNYAQILVAVTDKEIIFEHLQMTGSYKHIKKIPLHSFKFEERVRGIIFKDVDSISFMYEYDEFNNPNETEYIIIFKNSTEKYSFTRAVKDARDN